MRFFVTNWGDPRPHAEYPFVVLEKDNWNDYGYRTLYRPKIYLPDGSVIDLRQVKILKLGQTAADSATLGGSFETLDDTYCSLGQELAYYESLLTLDPVVRQEYLIALRDIAADDVIREQFESEGGYGTSLLRFGPAERALQDAPGLLRGESEDDGKLSFAFHTRFGSNEFMTRFDYMVTDRLPGRVNAIIGYNGTGKTKLLANLAWVASAELEARKQEEKILDYGWLEPAGLRFGHVITISYSAFDTFAVPQQQSRQFGYTYCGLRKHDQEGALKSPDEIAADIQNALPA